MPTRSRSHKVSVLIFAVCVPASLLCLRAMPQQVTYSKIATATAAPAGFASIVAPAQSIVVSTSAVTANSQIFVQFDETAGSGCTAGVTGLEANRYFVSARTANTNFTIKAASALPAGDTACLSYSIVN